MEYYDLINGAISRLKARKNRPHLENILNLLNKKKEIIKREDLEQALTQLEQLEKIQKVNYKGHHSFRQVESKNVPATSSQSISFNSDTEEDTQEKTEAFGIPLVETEDPDGSQGDLTLSIEDSVHIKQEGDRPQSRTSSDSDSVPDSSRKRKISPDSTPTTQRVSARKRVKKTHGPEWQTDAPQLDCKVILSTCGICRAKDLSSNLLTCSACKVSIHAKCLQLTDKSIAKISANKQFYCLRCKPCKVCKYHTNQELSEERRLVMPLPTILEGNNIIHCCQCYSVFHMVCLKPPISAKPKDRPWMCRKCSYEVNKKEKLKANAAATTMLLVAQQKPLVPAVADSKPARSEVTPIKVSDNPLSILKSSVHQNRGDNIKNSTPKEKEVRETVPKDGLKTDCLGRGDDPKAIVIEIDDEEDTGSEGKTYSKRTENNNNNCNKNDVNESAYARIPKKRYQETLGTETGQSKRVSSTSEKNGHHSELRKKLLEATPPPVKKNIEHKVTSENAGRNNERRVVVDVDSKYVKKNEKAEAVLPQIPSGPIESRPAISVIPIAPKSEESRRKEPSLILTASESVQSQANVINQVLVPFTLAPQLPVLSETASTPKGVAQFQINYPYVAEWNTEQICDFFSSLGYPKEAKVFSEQEIDGRSLLLLTRGDVLGCLGLKMGPAVKLFRHISNLQDVTKTSSV